MLKTLLTSSESHPGRVVDEVDDKVDGEKQWWWIDQKIPKSKIYRMHRKTQLPRLQLANF